MAKGFRDVGYKTPEDLTFFQKKFREWVGSMDFEDAVDQVAEWMRVPVRPVPHFLIRGNVRDWVEWLMEREVRSVTAEIRCLWYSFERVLNGGASKPPKPLPQPETTSPPSPSLEPPPEPSPALPVAPEPPPVTQKPVAFGKGSKQATASTPAPVEQGDLLEDLF